MLLMCFFNQKTAYDSRISDWRSDVCSSELRVRGMRYALGKGAENARLRFDKVYFQPASRSRSAMLFQHIGQPHQFGGKLYPGRASPNDSNRKMVVRGDRLKHCDTQPLAEGNGFAPAIDRHAMLYDAGCAEVVGSASRSQHQLVIGQDRKSTRLNSSH